MSSSASPQVSHKALIAIPPQPPPARVSSEALLGARGELLITHNGREYRLRLTQNGKLLLTA